MEYMCELKIVIVRKASYGLSNTQNHVFSILTSLKKIQKTFGPTQESNSHPRGIELQTTKRRRT